ncbi:hypothetical protein GCM10007973_26710 [Polymorphobacter multimanifer]|nr:hypothetical protein GCM10007973_26710 [Polymorphobacter multimanifer]
MAAKLLRLRPGAGPIIGGGAITVPHADVEHAVRAADHPSAIGAERAFPSLGDEYVLNGRQATRVEARACNRECRSRLRLAVLGVGDIKQIVPREVGMQHDVVKAAQTDVVEGRQARHRRRIEHAIGDHPQAAGPLGHQHGAPVGQEHQPIGMRQPLRQLYDPKPHAALASEEHRLVDRNAAQRIGGVVAGDLGSGQGRRDPRRVDRLGKHRHRHRDGKRCNSECFQGKRHKSPNRHISSSVRIKRSVHTHRHKLGGMIHTAHAHDDILLAPVHV